MNDEEKNYWKSVPVEEERMAIWNFDYEPVTPVEPYRIGYFELRVAKEIDRAEKIKP